MTYERDLQLILAILLEQMHKYLLSSTIMEELLVFLRMMSQTILSSKNLAFQRAPALVNRRRFVTHSAKQMLHCWDYPTIQ
jgi:hypothetical protein